MKHHTEITKQDLTNGEQFTFSNEAHQIRNGSDDIREATVMFREHDKQSWATGFKIEFNGKLVHSSKTFPPMIKKLQKLVNEWHLEPCESDDFI